MAGHMVRLVAATGAAHAPLHDFIWLLQPHYLISSHNFTAAQRERRALLLFDSARFRLTCDGGFR